MSASNLRRLAQGAVATYIAQVAGAFLVLGSQVLLANLLGKSEYGVFVYVVSWLAVLQAVALFGMDRTVIRFISEYRAQGEWSRLRGLLVYAHSIVFVIGVCVAIVMAATGVGLYMADMRQYAAGIVVGAVSLPFMAICMVRQAILQGLKRAPIAQIPELIVRPIVLGALAWLAYYVSENSLVGPGALGVYGVAVLVAMIVGSIPLVRTLPKEVFGKASTFQSREWIQMALPILALSSFHILNKRVDILFVGSIGGSDAAGVYGAASRFTDIVVFGLTAVNMVAAPYIAEYYAKNNHTMLVRMVRLTAWGALALCVPAAIAFVVVGRPLLEVFGEGFGVGYMPMVILAVGQVGNAATGPVGVILTMTGRQRHAAMVSGVLVVSNLGLNAVLVPLYGMNGAAIATATTTILNNVVVMMYVMKYMKINPTAFGTMPREGT